MNSREADPLVTVVLRTDGRSTSLRDAIESVCAQTYRRIELLVVDDGSSTSTESAVQRVDTRDLHSVRVVRHDLAHGGTGARNTAIRASTGDIVAFLDDGDSWTPGVVAAYVRAFTEHPSDVGLVVVGSETHGDHGRPVETPPPSFGDDPVDSLLSGALVGSYSRFAVRRSAVELVGLPDEGLGSWRDWEWQFRLALQWRFVSIPDPLVVLHDERDEQGDDFVLREAVSYPLLLDRLRPAMAARSTRDARRLVALLSRTLGHQALATGRYGTGIRYLCRSLAAEPTNRQTYLYLFVALGGPLTYQPARLANEWLSRLRRRVRV